MHEKAQELLKEAKKLFEEALQESVKNSVKKYNKVITKLDEAIKIERYEQSDHSELYFLRAKANLALGNHKDAQSDLGKAKVINPKYRNLEMLEIKNNTQLPDKGSLVEPDLDTTKEISLENKSGLISENNMENQNVKKKLTFTFFHK